MEIRLAVNAVPLLSLIAFLASLRTDLGTAVYGEEVYPGELRLWGVLFRLFCLAAFFRFRVLWPVVAYAGIYALFGQTLGRAIELATFLGFAAFLGGYRDVIVKNLSIDTKKARLSTPNASLPWTPFSALRHLELRQARGMSNLERSAGSRARSKSPGVQSSVRHRKPSGTPIALVFDQMETVKLSPVSLPTPTAPTGSSAAKTSGGTSALDELKRQKRKEQELRVASKAKSARGASKT